LLVVVVIVIRLVLGRRDDGALVGIDSDIEDIGPADFNVSAFKSVASTF